VLIFSFSANSGHCGDLPWGADIAGKEQEPNDEAGKSNVSWVRFRQSRLQVEKGAPRFIARAILLSAVTAKKRHHQLLKVPRLWTFERGGKARVFALCILFIGGKSAVVHILN